MFVCVECGTSINALFSSYGKDNIILEKCSQCHEIADKYTEFDGVIKVIDLILHKIPVYRHILINSSFKISTRQVILFFIYLAMIEVHLLQPENFNTYRSIYIFLSSIIYNLIYSLVIWTTFKLSKRGILLNNIRNALILGSFPQILHLLFVIWDYPRNDQFNNIINFATFTSHLSALSAIHPNTKLSLVSIVIAHLLAVQIKRLIYL